MSAISSVRGIGVAVIVSTSTLARNCLSRSLCATPKRCSSSTTSRPRSLKATSLPSSRWVPITTSTLPSFASCTICFCSALLTNRLSIFTRHRERREPFAERDEVLFGQERRRHEHRDLLALHHGLEGRADRDLGLAEADVAADQAVHRLGLFHVLLDVVDRDELVAGLLMREGIFELGLPGRVGAERVAGHRHPHRVEPDQLARHVLDGLLDASRWRGPSRCPPSGATGARRRRGTSRPCRPDRSGRRACRPARTRAPGSRARRRRAPGA